MVRSSQSSFSLGDTVTVILLICDSCSCVLGARGLFFKSTVSNEGARNKQSTSTSATNQNYPQKLVLCIWLLTNDVIVVGV